MEIDTMPEPTGVFKGRIAEAWINHIGRDGDAGRRYIIWPILHELLKINKFDLKRHGRALREAVELSIGTRPRTIKRARDAPLALLDIGCGEGWLSRMLPKDHSFVRRYHGIDPSIELVAKANSYGTPDATFSVANCAAAIPDLPESFDPTWIVAISLFDQFTDEDLLDFRIPNILGNLKSVLTAANARGKTIPLFAVTLDPAFFVPDEATGTAQAFDAECHYENNVKTIVRLRTPAWYEKVFTRAGFNIIDSMPISLHRFSDDALKSIRDLPNGPCVKAERISRGPFVFWLMTAQGGNIQSSNTCLLSSSAWSKWLSQLEWTTIVFEPGQRIRSAGSFGDALFYIADGSLEIQGTGHDTLTFVAGQVIGELELGNNFVASRFPFDVDAGPAGCTLLKFDASSLPSDLHDGLGGALFKQMREHFAPFTILTGRDMSRSDVSATLRDLTEKVRVISDRIVQPMEKSHWKEIAGFEHVQTTGRVLLHALARVRHGVPFDDKEGPSVRRFAEIVRVGEMAKRMNPRAPKRETFLKACETLRQFGLITSHCHVSKQAEAAIRNSFADRLIKSEDISSTAYYKLISPDHGQIFRWEADEIFFTRNFENRIGLLEQEGYSQFTLKNILWTYGAITMHQNTLMFFVVEDIHGLLRIVRDESLYEILLSGLHPDEGSKLGLAERRIARSSQTSRYAAYGQTAADYVLELNKLDRKL